MSRTLEWLLRVVFATGHLQDPSSILGQQHWQSLGPFCASFCPPLPTHLSDPFHVRKYRSYILNGSAQEENSAAISTYVPPPSSRPSPSLMTHRRWADVRFVTHTARPRLGGDRGGREGGWSFGAASLASPPLSGIVSVLRTSTDLSPCLSQYCSNRRSCAAGKAKGSGGGELARLPPWVCITYRVLPRYTVHIWTSLQCYGPSPTAHDIGHTVHSDITETDFRMDLFGGYDICFLRQVAAWLSRILSADFEETGLLFSPTRRKRESALRICGGRRCSFSRVR
ncbi:uncharacterized protein K489DRAFT_379874 [Dissoconium aciculare CBS 342.82]|uniref:Uncharacterized protein n=1 Tax=Dissoconium aciculare CBS 342.82 TaxID=1314786 RepID=A0A6J3M786_9PEZI|nr:uncharacterized protein K489DRAFT_379874 [Dissoconium aciculare CBS 342.82]KAF1823870.1 hypothetical protein K489DRAFT_379874 [Dissoconium aciculare CBS 342.82]